MGLIAQVSWTLNEETRDLMGKIRHKLNKTTPKQMKNLSWTTEEKNSFEQLKMVAAEAMEVGIQRMLREEVREETTPMVLTSDWSKKGTGFQLHNVSCECHRKNEGDFRHQCCEDEWRLVYTGGRFNTSAEANYAPVEGELLGIAITLHKSRFLTYGPVSYTHLTLPTICSV